MTDFPPLVKKYWHDPVWSKVIAYLFITILGAITLKVYAFIEGIRFLQAGTLLLKFFFHKTSIHNILLFCVLLSLTLALYKLVVLRRKLQRACKVSISGRTDKEDLDRPRPLPPLGIITTGFFQGRICDAFPTSQELLILDNPKVIHDRFDIFFREPIVFCESSADMRNDPIWLFRGSSSLHIDKYRRLSMTKCLLKYDEYRLSRIAVYRSSSYYKAFIYCEAFAEKSVPVYKYEKGEIEEKAKNGACSTQEYAIWNKRIITRQEYDDGSAIRNGKVVLMSGAELRVRRLTKYNFMLAAPDSPMNSQKFGVASGPIFDGLLKSSHTITALVSLVESLHKSEK